MSCKWCFISLQHITFLSCCKFILLLTIGTFTQTQKYQKEINFLCVFMLPIHLLITKLLLNTELLLAQVQLCLYYGRFTELICLQNSFKVCIRYLVLNIPNLSCQLTSTSLEEARINMLIKVTSAICIILPFKYRFKYNFQKIVTENADPVKTKQTLSNCINKEHNKNAHFQKERRELKVTAKKTFFKDFQDEVCRVAFGFTLNSQLLLRCLASESLPVEIARTHCFKIWPRKLTAIWYPGRSRKDKQSRSPGYSAIKTISRKSVQHQH